jgi:cytochrome c
MKASWVGIVATTAALMLAGHASAADVEAGKLAFGKSVCKGCHAVDYEGYGPSFQDIGRKYAGVASAKADLTKKITDGTKGTWGDAVMPPQKGAVSDENISAIVDFILSFK